MDELPPSPGTTALIEVSPRPQQQSRTGAAPLPFLHCGPGSRTKRTKGNVAHAVPPSPSSRRKPLRPPARVYRYHRGFHGEEGHANTHVGCAYCAAGTAAVRMRECASRPRTKATARSWPRSWLQTGSMSTPRPSPRRCVPVPVPVCPCSHARAHLCLGAAAACWPGARPLCRLRADRAADRAADVVLTQDGSAWVGCSALIVRQPYTHNAPRTTAAAAQLPAARLACARTLLPHAYQDLAPDASGPHQGHCLWWPLGKVPEAATADTEPETAGDALPNACLLALTAVRACLHTRCMVCRRRLTGGGRRSWRSCWPYPTSTSTTPTQTARRQVDPPRSKLACYTTGAIFLMGF